MKLRGPGRRTLEERIERKLDKSGECWLWTGAKVTGYGHMRVDGKSVTLHRLMWTRTYGEIPDGLWVLHKCDVRACCNPAHLFLGDRQDNIDDMVTKQRHTHGTRAASAKLTEDQVREIFTSPKEYKELGEQFGIAISQVHNIKYRKRWQLVTEDLA